MHKPKPARKPPMAKGMPFPAKTLKFTHRKPKKDYRKKPAGSFMLG